MTSEFFPFKESEPTNGNTPNYKLVQEQRLALRLAQQQASKDRFVKRIWSQSWRLGGQRGSSMETFVIVAVGVGVVGAWNMCTEFGKVRGSL